MAVLHITRIRNAFHKLFDDYIDLTDYDGKPDAQRDTAFLSRSLAAYSLVQLAEITAELAGKCVTDGFDDNGIDLVFFDEEHDVLYAGQSKWIEAGHGTISQGDSKKFLDGFRDLVNLRLERFNRRLQSHGDRLRSALYDANVRIVLVIGHTGNQPLSQHVRRDVEDLLAEMNDPVELVTIEVLDQARLYDGIAGHAERSTVNMEIMLREWGNVQQPYPAYYGHVDASSIAKWWSEHGRSLLHRNIRSFKGSTDVNNALAATLHHAPADFWYFNNGITLLCSKAKKKPIGGAGRDTAVFECEGVSIVNGAQTVGVIGTFAESNSTMLDSVRVSVRLISLETCPDGFDKAVARATNTQNRIERRDFAALDPNQRRLASELLLDGKHYAYKSGDTDPDPENGCSIVDATVSIACATPDVALAVQAKREIGRLWEDIESAPYTTIFNDRTTATALWRSVEIMRAVESRLQQQSRSALPRAEMIAVHGSRLILHRVFHDERVRGYCADCADFAAIISAVPSITDRVFSQLVQHLEAEHANAYLASLFKNVAKCREVNGCLAGQPDNSTEAPHIGDVGSREPIDEERTLFDSLNSGGDVGQ